MDVNIGAYSAAASASGRRESSSKSVRHESMSDSSTTGRGRATKKEKKNSGLGRQHSGSSTSMMSEASYSSKSSKKKTKKSRSITPDDKSPKRDDTKKKIQKMAGGERKGSLVDKWSKMMDEYEESYIPDKKEERRESKVSVKQQRKVSKIGNVDEKYDNVKQVFGRSMPLAHQTAPPGAKAKDIESESERSETSQRSVRKSSKGHHQTRKQSSGTIASEISQSESRRESVNSLYPGWRPGAKMVEAKWLTNRSTEQQSGQDSGSRQGNLSSSQSVSHQQVTKETIERTPHVYHKEKYRKHRKDGKKDIEETAAEIVDDVVNKALKLLYGTKTTKIKNLKTQKDLHDQRAYEENINSNYSETNISDVTEMHHRKHSKNIRKEHVQEVHGSGKERKYSIRPVPGSAKGRKASQGGWKDDGYEVHLGAYGDSEESSVQSPSSPVGNYRQDGYYSTSDSYNYNSLPSQKKQANLGLTRVDHMQSGNYSSDSEYSTTLEINRDKDHNIMFDEHGNRIRHYSGGSKEQRYFDSQGSNTKHGRKPRPPTLTKGTVTKIKHELQQQELVHQPPPIGPRPEVIEAVQAPPVVMSPPPEPVTRHVHIAPTALVDGYAPVEQYRQAEVLEIKPNPTTSMSHTYILNQPYVVTSAMSMPNTFPGGQIQYAQNHNLLLQQAQPQKVDFLIDATQLLDQQKLELLHHQQQEQEHELPTIQEVDENQYAAFSNEPIIVAGVDKDGRNRGSPLRDEQHVIEGSGGKVYGTQPAVNMSTRQQLNFYVFNQVKKESEPAPILEEPMVMLDVPDSKADLEVEYKEMEIYNKGTQTLVPPEPTPPPRRKKIIKETTQKTLSQAPPPVTPPPQQREIHHYITTERHIEKLSPDREVVDMFCQTEPPLRTPSPVQEQVSEAVFTQAFAAPVARVPTPPPPTPTPEESESEEEIIETIVVEEHEQRIIMSIAEEIEFSSSRTQGGTTVNTTNEDGQVKPFWIPEKWEAVVDRRKQKMIKVKDTEKEDEDTKQGIGPLAHTTGATQPVPLPPPKFTTETSTSKSSSSLEKELEKQLHSPPDKPKPKPKPEPLTIGENYVYERSRSREIPITKRSNSYEYKIPIERDFPLRTNRSPSPPRRPMWEKQAMRPVEHADSESDTSEKRFTTQQTFYVNSSKPPAPPPPPPTLKTTSREIKINKTAALTNHNTPEQEPVFSFGSLRGSLKKSNIALPADSSFSNRAREDDDKLPESLDHFDQVLATLERELPLPMSPVTPPKQGRSGDRVELKKRPPADYVQSYKETNYPSTTARTFTNIAANTKPTYLGKFNQSYLRPEETHHQVYSTSTESQYNDVGIPYKLKSVSSPTSNGIGTTIYSSKPVQRTNSKLEPDNFSFGRRHRGGQETMGESDEMLFDPAEEYLTPRALSPDSGINHSIQTVDGLDGSVVHSSQSEPRIQTRIEKDGEGNLVKVTEMKHTLSKTLESAPSDRNSIASDQISYPTENRDLSRQSFVNMNLMETRTERVVEAESETDTETAPPSPLRQRPMVPEVTEDTQVKVIPVEFDVLQKSLKVTDDDGIPTGRHSFLYNMNTNELHQHDSNEEMRRKYLAGETMRTSL